MTEALTYVEISLRRCSRTYGVAPCTASIPATGVRKCYQGRATCQDIDNYADASGLTVRFAKPAAYRPKDIEAFPFIKSVDYTPAVVSLGKDLGQRAQVSITFTDAPDSDTFPGLDPYLSTRDYDPYSQGTFFGKLRARHPYLLGRSLSLISGYVGQELADMETRHFLIDSYEGPTPKGEFIIRASDVLKLGNADKAMAPVMSSGSLIADITDSATSLTLSPTGAGDDYSAGLLNLGGKEIVRYWVSGLDDYVTLLLHCNGADASTTFTDSSASAHTVTVGGNAQIDTAQSKFGGASALFDGTGDYLQLNGSSDFAFGTDDFTIDFWARRNSTGGLQILYDSRPTGVEGLYPTIYFAADNTLRYYTNSADRITSAGTFSTGSWIHIALVRASGVTKLYADGVQQGSSYTDSNSYLNGASRPQFAYDGLGPGNGFNGWLDEIRISKGLARWPAAFTAPTAAAGTSTDVVQLPARGLLNTTAVSHSAGDRAQVVLAYIGEDAADIIYDLCTNYITGFDPDWIDLPAWQTETATYNGTVYTAYICEPTAVKTLIEELVLQAALAIWWDDIDELVRLQVLRAIPTSAFDYTADNMLRGTLATREQLDQRLSQVQIYFGQINPLLPLSNKDNYRSQVSVSDTVAEANWVQPAITTILSRWIPQAGKTVAERLAAILLGRFKTPPRHVSFEVQRYAETDPELGGGYRFSNAFVQDETGATSDASIPIQVTQLKVYEDRIAVEAEEMLFDVPAADLASRSITFSASTFNPNLRTEHDSIYPEPTGSETVTFYIMAGVVIGSRDATLPAIDVGTWPAGTTIVIVNAGRIQGKGGAGGGNQPLGAQSGGDGGTAIYTRKPLSLDNTSGEIFGGGGGGSAKYAYPYGGGGGAGADGGAGGWGTVVDGNPGTADAGGNSGSASFAGFGGGPGLAGSSPTFGDDVGHSPGDAGAAVDGHSYVTYTASGDIRGGQVN